MEIAALALLIPIVAITGKYLVQILQLRTQSGLGQDDKKLLEKLASENADLRERVENLETIITSLDKELLALTPNRLTNYQIQKQVEELAAKLEARS